MARNNTGPAPDSPAIGCTGLRSVRTYGSHNQHMRSCTDSPLLQPGCIVARCSRWFHPLQGGKKGVIPFPPHTSPVGTQVPLARNGTATFSGAAANVSPPSNVETPSAWHARTTAVARNSGWMSVRTAAAGCRVHRALCGRAGLRNGHDGQSGIQRSALH